VFQESVLFRRSVHENIAYGKPGAKVAEVEAAARAAKADEFIQALPEGYDTILDEQGSNLSGGQRQRLALARAFLRNAPILVLDEPSSGLDAVTEAQLSETIDELAQGRTTIVIAHRLSTVERADRILVLDRGRIAEEGRHEELLQRGGLYRALYDAQATEVF
jgi:ABC-type multidrug transport system fused ATPase/permease subunit